MHLQAPGPSAQRAPPCCDRMVADPGVMLQKVTVLKLPSVLRDGCRLHALCYALVSPLATEGLFFPGAIPALRPCRVKHPCVYAAGSLPSLLCW